MDKSTFLKLLLAYLVSVVVVIAILFFLGVDATISKSGQEGPPIVSGPIIFIPVVVVGLFVVFLMIGIGIAVHRDALQRSMEAPLVWALVAALGPYLLGLIIYLIIRRPIQSHCGSCGKALSGTESFCPHCGQQVRASCSNCARPVDATARFCPHCGAKLAVEE